MKQGIIIGAVCIVIGIGVFAYYENVIRYEREARELLTEGTLIYERGTRESINDSINIFSKVIARYPGTRAETEAYYHIAQSYEKLNLNRLAYLKYVYLLKNNRNTDQALARDVRARIARLRVMRRYTEEGVHQLLGLLDYSDSREFRSRVYAELGHAYLQMTEFEKSKRMFDIALSENGENEEAMLGKARAYKRLGQDDQAYGVYEYFMKYYGNFSPYAADVRAAYERQVYRTGHENYRKGSYSAAIGYFKRILRYLPESAYVGNCYYWIGQCYLAIHKYDSAINYFDRTLGWGGSKSEDARIRKGNAYFLMKKFDLAAREFQIYMNTYPHGKYADTARKWKSMSTQEMLYRIQNRMVPDSVEEESIEENRKGAVDKNNSSESGNDPSNKAMTGNSGGLERAAEEYENVGEL